LTTGLLTIAFAGVFIVPMGYAVNLFLEVGPDFQHLRWDWKLPAWERVHLLILLGSIGMVGYMLLSRAYQIAPASLIAPFDYTYLPFATAMAYVVWAEVPAVNTLIGMALIVGGGIYLGYREIIAARRVVEPAPTAEAVFVPGSPAGALAQLADTADDRATSATAHSARDQSTAAGVTWPQRQALRPRFVDQPSLVQERGHRLDIGRRNDYWRMPNG
jgi:hypothetical protein